MTFILLQKLSGVMFYFNEFKSKAMARPIEETPMLKGEDAKRFIQRMEENHRVSQAEYERMQRAYEIGMKIVEWD